jgi:hypothetical protein
VVLFSLSSVLKIPVKSLDLVDLVILIENIHVVFNELWSKQTGCYQLPSNITIHFVILILMATYFGSF